MTTVLKFRKKWDQADIAIDNFLKPPQCGLAFRRASGHGNGLIAEGLRLGIDIAPAVPEAVRQPVPVDEVAGIRGPGPPVIDRHIDLFLGHERPFLDDGHFLDGELDAELGQALLDQHGRFFVKEVAGRDGHGHREALWHLRLRQFRAGFLYVGFIGPELLHIATDIFGTQLRRRSARPCVTT